MVITCKGCSGLVATWREKQGIMVNTTGKVDQGLEFGKFKKIMLRQTFYLIPTLLPSVIAHIWGQKSKPAVCFNTPRKLLEGSGSWQLVDPKVWRWEQVSWQALDVERTQWWLQVVDPGGCPCFSVPTTQRLLLVPRSPSLPTPIPPPSWSLGCYRRLHGFVASEGGRQRNESYPASRGWLDRQGPWWACCWVWMNPEANSPLGSVLGMGHTSHTRI